jgi:hypothetical protein
VPERLEIKREVFAQLDEACPSHTILATNSSSIRISAIENATHRPDKVLNMHFYPQRAMVELMRGTATSDETIENARQFARTLGLTPLLVRKESTGFIFQLGRPFTSSRSGCSGTHPAPGTERQSAPLCRGGVARADKDRTGTGSVDLASAIRI